MHRREPSELFNHGRQPAHGRHHLLDTNPSPLGPLGLKKIVGTTPKSDRTLSSRCSVSDAPDAPTDGPQRPELTPPFSQRMRSRSGPHPFPCGDGSHRHHVVRRPRRSLDPSRGQSRNSLRLPSYLATTVPPRASIPASPQQRQWQQRTFAVLG